MKSDGGMALLEMVIVTSAAIAFGCWQDSTAAGIFVWCAVAVLSPPRH